MQLADGFPLADTTFEARTADVPGAASPEQIVRSTPSRSVGLPNGVLGGAWHPAASAEAGAERTFLTTDDRGCLSSWPSTLEPARTTLTCITWPWLPPARFSADSPDDQDGVYRIPGGRLEVTVHSPTASALDVRIEVHTRPGIASDRRRIAARTGEPGAFLLVESGDYAVRAATADGSLQAERTIAWRPGEPRVELFLRDAGAAGLDVSVVDGSGAHIAPFAVEVTGQKGFYRLVHSDDLPLGSMILGLPEGRLTAQLVPRLKAPPSVYRPGARSRVELVGGEVRQIVLTSARLCCIEVHVAGRPTGDWELQRYEPAGGNWSRVELCRFRSEGGVQFLNSVREPGLYYSTPIDAVPGSFRFARTDTRDAIGVDVAPAAGTIVPLQVALN